VKSTNQDCAQRYKHDRSKIRGGVKWGIANKYYHQANRFPEQKKGGGGTFAKESGGEIRTAVGVPKQKKTDRRDQIPPGEEAWDISTGWAPPKEEYRAGISSRRTRQEDRVIRKRGMGKKERAGRRVRKNHGERNGALVELKSPFK